MSFLEDLGSSAVDFGFGKAAQEDSQQFMKHMFKHRYQWTVEDMRKAGLNPVLAAGLNPSSGGAPMMNTPRTQFGATSARRAQAEASKAQARAAAGQVSLMGTQEEKNRADEALANSARDLNNMKKENADLENRQLKIMVEALEKNPELAVEKWLKESMPDTVTGFLGRMLGGAGLTPGQAGSSARGVADEAPGKLEKGYTDFKKYEAKANKKMEEKFKQYSPAYWMYDWFVNRNKKDKRDAKR